FPLPIQMPKRFQLTVNSIILTINLKEVHFHPLPTKCWKDCSRAPTLRGDYFFKKELRNIWMPIFRILVEKVKLPKRSTRAVFNCGRIFNFRIFINQFKKKKYVFKNSTFNNHFHTFELRFYGKTSAER